MERSDLVLAIVRTSLANMAVERTLTKPRHRHFPWGISHIFLIINVIVSMA